MAAASTVDPNPVRSSTEERPATLTSRITTQVAVLYEFIIGATFATIFFMLKPYILFYRMIKRILNGLNKDHQTTEAIVSSMKNIATVTSNFVQYFLHGPGEESSRRQADLPTQPTTSPPIEKEHGSDDIEEEHGSDNNTCNSGHSRDINDVQTSSTHVTGDADHTPADGIQRRHSSASLPRPPNSNENGGNNGSNGINGGDPPVNGYRASSPTYSQRGSQSTSQPSTAPKNAYSSSTSSPPSKTSAAVSPMDSSAKEPKPSTIGVSSSSGTSGFKTPEKDGGIDEVDTKGKQQSKVSPPKSGPNLAPGIGGGAKRATDTS